MERKTPMTAVEWTCLRGFAGQPRRFSDAFVEEERQKLRDFREIFREIIKAMQ